jgi:hypothetical protein
LPRSVTKSPETPPAELARTLALAEDRVRPATAMEFAALLAPCLALCAPSGMTSDDRAEWLKAARMSIGDFPADVLEAACRSARLTCDHPAKIVPHIAKQASDEMEERRRQLRIAQSRAERRRDEAQNVADDTIDPAHCQEMARRVRELIGRLGDGPV